MISSEPSRSATPKRATISQAPVRKFPRPVGIRKWALPGMRLSTTAVLLLAVFITGVISIVSGERDAPFSITLFLDLYILSTALFLMRRKILHYKWYLLFFSAYLLFFALNSLHNGAEFSYVLISSKFIIYVILFIILGDPVSKVNIPLLFIYRIGILLFLLKYLMYIFLVGGTRPGLLVENNFELATLLIVALVALKDRRASFLDLAAVSLIVALSGSRSGALTLVLLLTFGLMAIEKYSERNNRLIIAGLFVALLVAIPFALTRFGSGYSILESDRFLFLSGFLHEIKERGLANLILGSLALSPLGADVCTPLLAWNRVFGELNEEVCYSVVLHSGIMRIIIDHGLIVLLITLCFFYRYLTSLFSTRTAIGIMLVVLTNSLSVSGFFSSFFALGLFLVVLLRNTVKPIEPVRFSRYP